MPAPLNEKVYWFSAGLFRLIYQTFLSGDVAGLARIPRSGGCIVAVNHASHFDPPIAGCLVPRRINYFARKTLWAGGFASWWLDSVGTIPVDRDGDSDIAAMKRTLGALKDGGVVTMFPEGTRSPDGRLQSAKPGIGLIAAKSQATIVPCRIFNSHKVLSKASKIPNLDVSVHLVYGRPITPADYDPGKAAGKDRYQIAADRIMAAIAALPRPRPQIL